MNMKSLTTIRSLAVGVVLVCAPFTQACSENDQSAAEVGAAKLKQAQAQAAAEKLAAKKAEEARVKAEQQKAQKLADAKAAEAQKAVEDAKAAQAAAAKSTTQETKAQPIKIADASSATKPAAGAAAATAATAVANADAPPEFTEAFLNDDANIVAGGELWAQCRHCHGAKAYPGKAPKLKPGKYKPSFVYSRITKGYRKMPPWKDVFSQEQRMQLVAFIKSRKFSP